MNHTQINVTRPQAELIRAATLVAVNAANDTANAAAERGDALTLAMVQGHCRTLRQLAAQATTQQLLTISTPERHMLAAVVSELRLRAINGDAPLRHDSAPMMQARELIAALRGERCA